MLGNGVFLGRSIQEQVFFGGGFFHPLHVGLCSLFGRKACRVRWFFVPRRRRRVVASPKPTRAAAFAAAVATASPGYLTSSSGRAAEEQEEEAALVVAVAATTTTTAGQSVDLSEPATALLLFRLLSEPRGSITGFSLPLAEEEPFSPQPPPPLLPCAMEPESVIEDKTIELMVSERGSQESRCGSSLYPLFFPQGGLR